MTTPERWPFMDSPSLAVFSLKRIFKQDRPVLYVLHDEDGGWQFLDGEDCTEDDAAVVAFEEIVAHDPTLRELAALPLGFHAVRESVEGPWQVGYTGGESDEPDD